MGQLGSVGVGLCVVFAAFMAVITVELYYVWWSRRRRRRRVGRRSLDVSAIAAQRATACADAADTADGWGMVWLVMAKRGVNLQMSRGPAAAMDEELAGCAAMVAVKNQRSLKEEAVQQGEFEEEDDEIDDIFKMEGLWGPPRLLFTITEETEEEMAQEAEEDGHARSRCSSSSPYLTPPSSPPFATPLGSPAPPYPFLHPPWHVSTSPHSAIPADEQLVSSHLSSNSAINSGLPPSAPLSMIDTVDSSDRGAMVAALCETSIDISDPLGANAISAGFPDLSRRVVYIISDSSGGNGIAAGLSPNIVDIIGDPSNAIATPVSSEALPDGPLSASATCTISGCLPAASVGPVPCAVRSIDAAPHPHAHCITVNIHPSSTPTQGIDHEPSPAAFATSIPLTVNVGFSSPLPKITPVSDNSGVTVDMASGATTADIPSSSPSRPQFKEWSPYLMSSISPPSSIAMTDTASPAPPQTCFISPKRQQRGPLSLLFDPPPSPSSALNYHCHSRVHPVSPPLTGIVSPLSNNSPCKALQESAASPSASLRPATPFQIPDVSQPTTPTPFRHILQQQKRVEN